MSQPQAVIFDIGNVLIEWNPDGFYDGRIGEARRKQFFAEVPIGAANLAVDAGAPFRATIAGLMQNFLHWQAEAEKGQRGLERDRVRHLDRCHDDQRRQAVGQDVAEHDAPRGQRR